MSLIKSSIRERDNHGLSMGSSRVCLSYVRHIYIQRNYIINVLYSFSFSLLLYAWWPNSFPRQTSLHLNAGQYHYSLSLSPSLSYILYNILFRYNEGLHHFFVHYSYQSLWSVKWVMKIGQDWVHTIMIILGTSIVVRNINCALLTLIAVFWLGKAYSDLAESFMPWDMGVNIGD